MAPQADRRDSGLARLTVNEAAYVAGVSVKTANQTIDRRQIRARRPRRPTGRQTRGMGIGDVVYLRIQHVLAPEIRAKFYRALQGKSLADLPRSLEAGDVIIDLSRAIEEVARRLDSLIRIRTRVELDPAVRGGEPVFRDTRVPVYTIARKLELGSTAEELLEDYPRLAETDLETASLYAHLYPRQGRPPTE